MEEKYPSYKHTKLGTLLFNITYKATKFLVRHPVLYYILACTWGLPLTLIGWIITPFIMLFSKQKPLKYYFVYYFKVGKSWGGFETGLMFVRDKYSNSSVSKHEFGHTFQNCVFGPFTLFLITIPSMLRYWSRRLSNDKPQTDYDAVWFEDSATTCGEYAQTYLYALKNQNRKSKGR